MSWYDNASNIAGKYDGARALLKRDYFVAHFVPCFGHSLNLASNESANCVPEATTFFGLLRNIHAFILQCINTSLENFVSVTVDSDSKISKSNTLVSQVLLGLQKRCVWGRTKYSMFMLASQKINLDEIADTRLQVESMVNKMVRLEYGILTDLWATLLNRYNIVSMALHSSSLDLHNAVAVLESLCQYVVTLREQFDIFE